MIINKRAKYDYEILETYEAGLVLRGFEVKAVREGKMSLHGSYVTLHSKGGATEVYLINAHISPYQAKNTEINYTPLRSRKLLLHKQEIQSLLGKVKQKSLTLIPICVYNNKKRIKIKFALAKGKRKIDKREDIKNKEVTRQIRRRFLSDK